MEGDKVHCLNPNPGKAGTRIDRWKYDRVREILLALVPAQGPGVRFKDLAGGVEQGLSAPERERLGSIGWYTTVVKLDLEARGEIERVPGSSPQRLVHGGRFASGQEEIK